MAWLGLTWAGMIVAAYLIGSVPTAILVTRLLKGQDIRQLGDQNPGAANVYRNVGPKAGLFVGAMDILKGAVAILVIRGVVDSTNLEIIAGVAVVAGHNWPVYLGWRGGRGAATAIGVMFAMLPVITLPLGALGLVVLHFSNRATYAIGFFLIATPVLAWPGGYSYPVIGYSVGLPLFVGFSHVLSTKVFPPPGTVAPVRK